LDAGAMIQSILRAFFFIVLSNYLNVKSEKYNQNDDDESEAEATEGVF
jgi:hypothetical protein